MKKDWNKDALAWIYSCAYALIEYEHFDNAQQAIDLSEQWALDEMEESGTENVDKWMSIGDVIHCAFGNRYVLYTTVVRH